MATFSELVVKLELQQQAFQKGMDSAARSLARVQSSAKGAQGSMARLESGLNGIAKAAAAAGTAFATIKGVEVITKAADQIRNLQGSFTALLGDAGRASDMLQRVFDTVSKTGAPLDAVASSTQRLIIAMQSMGASNAQIQAVTETFLELGKIGGASAAETAAALQQLGQALASGKLGGDELRSIRENAPLVAQAIADSIGVTSGQLKQLGEDGKLTADVVANALIKASDKAAAGFAQLPQGLEQATNRMVSQATQTAAQFDKIGGLTQTLVTSTQFVTEMLKRWADELSTANNEMSATKIIAQSMSDLARLAAVAFVAITFALEQVIKRTAFWGEQLKLLIDLDWSGMIASTERFNAQLEKAADAANRTIEALLKGQALAPPAASAAQARAAARGDELRPIPPLTPPPATGGGGGGGKSEADDLKKRGEALTASVDAQAAYNQKLKEYQELLDKGAISTETFTRAVQKAKDELTSVNDTMRASLDPVFAYGQEMERLDRLFKQNIIDLETFRLASEEAAKKLQEFLDKQKEKSPAEQLAESMTQAIGSGIGQFFDDIITGAKSASDAFNQMVKKIISDLAKLLAEFAAKEAAKFIIKSIFGGGATPGGKSAAPASLMLASRPVTWNAAASLAPGARAGEVGAGTATTGGVGGQGAPWNVVINNNAPGVDVSAMPRADGGLEVTVEKVRTLLAQDVARGGNPFSRSLESAYGLGRGR